MLYYNVNPNSLRPYHTTLGPAAGPTCSKILAPPLCRALAKKARSATAFYSRSSFRQYFQTALQQTERLIKEVPSGEYKENIGVIERKFTFKSIEGSLFISSNIAIIV